MKVDDKNVRKSRMGEKRERERKGIYAKSQLGRNSLFLHT